jgi:RNA polymerase sigma-70 factor (ECF subfamily)
VTPENAFDQHHQAVYSFAYRLTRRQDVAEDITQECFLFLIRSPQRFDAARGSMRVFLFSIARNLALKHYRDDHPSEPLDGVEVFIAADPRGSLEISSAVATAVAGLPHLQQEALILFEYEGVTLEEIAQITGADTGTVKSRLHRARTHLRRVLAEYRKTGSEHAAI